VFAVDGHVDIAGCLPGVRVESVVPLGEGQDNVAFEVNGELVVRFGKESDRAARAARVDREGRLLAFVASVAPVPVPLPVPTAEGGGCLAYRKLPGSSLLDAPMTARQAHGPAVASTLGRLLRALHAVPADRVDGLVGVDDQPLPQWLADAAELVDGIGAGLPDPFAAPVRAFLAAPPPPGGHPLVFSHNDLGIEHVLVDQDTFAVTGVLDWTDAALVDPAYDFGLLHRDLGPAGIHAALDAYGPSTMGLPERALFYARCSVLEDLAYGLETGLRRYVDNSIAALEWLF
jgi:aminoglycoside phosphotransferase (APT) family kinase protein